MKQAAEGACCMVVYHDAAAVEGEAAGCGA